MEGLTTTDDKTLLLGKIKSFLSITWEDVDTDNEIWDFIVTSENRINEIAGIELDYLLTPDTDDADTDIEKLYSQMCYLGQDLLKNRVFYQREKGLDDFETNYRREVISLYNYGRIYRANQVE